MSRGRDDLARRRTGLRGREVVRVLVQGTGFARHRADSLRLSSALQCLVRSLPYWKTLGAWLRHPRDAALQEAIALRPSLLRCVLRPYLNVQWGATRKLDAVRTHYQLLRGRRAFLRFHPSRSITLGTVAGRVAIRLEKASWFEHEGELALSLFEGETRLYSIAFTLGLVDSRTVAYVGALQGLGRSDAREIYRSLTRGMHGLRPRDLLIAAFRDLCRSLGVEQILAVADATCVGRSAYFTAKAPPSSSYDRAWLENGGASGEDGFFRLSPAPVRRAMGEIASRKRAEHRRRYAMLDLLAAEIHRAVDDAAAVGIAQPVEPARRRPSVNTARIRSERTSDGWSSDFAASSFSRY